MPTQPPPPPRRSTGAPPPTQPPSQPTTQPTLRPTTPPTPRPTARHPVRFGALLAAAGVVVLLLVALPLAAIWLRVRIAPTRYEGLGGVVVLLWQASVAPAAAAGLIRLAALWSQQPDARDTAVRTGLLACVPGACVLAAALAFSLVIGAF